jgi:hypothetical protein
VGFLAFLKKLINKQNKEKINANRQFDQNRKIWKTGGRENPIQIRGEINGNI